MESPEPAFIFVACHPWATRFCRAEIARIRPAWLPAFSRPGWLTFKVTEPLPDRFDLPSTFARTWGFSIENLRASAPGELADAVERFRERFGPFDTMHFWDRRWTSERRSVASESDAWETLANELARRTPGWSPRRQSAMADARVLDIIGIDDGQFAIGWHIAGATNQRWPGGVPHFRVPENMISRAWLKTSEALLWSGMPVSRGSRCVEIGSAPGGSCQRLLQSGAEVVCVDPAELHPQIAGDPRVTHLRMRGRDVPHRLLRGADWLLVDTNIAPQSAMQMTESLVCGERVKFRGLLLTLKMLDERLAGDLDGYMDRARSWGFRLVKARHLAWGRREICLAALRQKSVRRFRKRTSGG
jgi:23S rRNA (cytidine2498-2'-O)-methyltransferase